MRLHWHRRDLRLSDNRGLSIPDDPPAGIFVFDASVLQHASSPRAAFLFGALERLREEYRTRGSDLLVRRGDPEEILLEVARTYDVDTVSWNRDYSGLARRRDERVGEKLEEEAISTQRFHDALCHAPGTITTERGEPYSLYSYFWRKWRDRETDPPREIPALAAAADDEPIPTIDEFGLESPSASIPDAGTRTARELLSRFLQADVSEYAERRDYPAEACTSRLSPHLKFGTIGIREVDTAVREAIDAVSEETRASVVEFRSQLAWREFYAHVLFFHPEIVTENYRSYENEIEWENDDELLAAWKRGKTGYPIVDAGMRQLRAEAFMHNRVRMIVASFLTKDLLIDWRYGYDHFRDHLVDHDTANDVGGWQWAASTGTDAQPYFRIFNPTTQGERYDPEASYVAAYVPELRDVDPTVVHSWPDLSADERREHAPEYVDPVVDHRERRQRALSMFERARGEDSG